MEEIRGGLRPALCGEKMKRRSIEECISIERREIPNE